MPTIYPITEGLHVCTTVACHFPELSDNSICIKLAVKNAFMIFDLTAWVTWYPSVGRYWVTVKSIHRSATSSQHLNHESYLTLCYTVCILHHFLMTIQQIMIAAIWHDFTMQARNGDTCASSTAFSLCDAKMPIHVLNYQLEALHVLTFSFVTGTT